MIYSERSNFRRIFILMCILIFAQSISAADWPMWRGDASRSASVEQELPEQLYLCWQRQYTARKMVWDDPLNQDLMPYDRFFEPIVAGKRMFVGFNDSDKLVCLDTDSGREIWSYYTDGPVRMPPVAWQGKVYAVSDDGCLYCLDQGSGSLIWKHRGAPGDRKIIGNRRLISTWPARGGAVISEGLIYYAASIWPFMGTFIYALDASTGEPAWVNDQTGSEYRLQPHHSPAFAGVAPQGAFVATPDDGLLIPGGRSVPAMFERSTGNERYYHLSEQNKSGGSFVCSGDKVFFSHHRDQVCSMYDLATGERLVSEIGSQPVIDNSFIYLFSDDTLRCYDSRRLEKMSRWWLDGWFWEKGLWKLSNWKKLPEWAGDILDDWKKSKNERWRQSEHWKLAADCSEDLIRAGGMLYGVGDGRVVAVKLPQYPVESPQVIWTMQVPGSAARVMAADDKLFVVSKDGRIMAFGAVEKSPENYPLIAEKNEIDPDVRKRAKLILESAGTEPGYALVYGLGDGSLLEELAGKSNLQIVGIDPDSDKIETIRRRLDRAGVYGSRVAVHRGAPETFNAPPYLARMIVLNEFDPGSAAAVIHSLRPYGGKLWIENAGKVESELVEKVIKVSGVENIELGRAGNSLVLSRVGALPGAGSWTHQYGDIGNTAKSDDRLVRLPLGILWFGGSSNLDVLPRHGHGPPEQVIGGRLFIEGLDCISARDVYTGEVLWKTEITELNKIGVYYDGSYKDTPTSTSYNQEHLPGANIRGTNFVATADRVYVASGNRCLVLDSATGEILDEIALSADKDTGEPPEWAYIGVWDDLLIAGCGFSEFSEVMPRDSEELDEVKKLSESKRNARLAATDYDKSASRRITVFDRHSGKPQWSIAADYGFLHNGIVASKGRIYLLDKLNPYLEAKLARRGIGNAGEGKSRLLSLDIGTGKIFWETRENVFGSWLGVSQEHDILLQSTRPSRDMVRGEDGERMIAYSAGDGQPIWDRNIKYSSVPIIHGDKIVTIGKMNSLLNGEQVNQQHPLTDEIIPVTWRRNYGCNYPIASENLLTFRSAAAGFYDLTSNGGTGNMGGFKSGCTSNLVVADGVLNAPDYTRTCSCSYQNQTSLAMIFDAFNEFWTFNDIERGSAPIRRLGINFGAPGDRADSDGTLWIDYPSRGGPSPEVPISISGDKVQWFYDHSSVLGGSDKAWIAASGISGARTISIDLGGQDKNSDRSYNLRLFFRSDLVGSFEVSVQGNNTENRIEEISGKGADEKVIVKEIDNVVVGNRLVLTLKPLEGETSISGIELTDSKLSSFADYR